MSASSNSKATAPVPAVTGTKPEAKSPLPMPGKPGAPEVKAAPSAPYVPKPVKQETTSTEEPKPTKAAALAADVEISKSTETIGKGKQESASSGSANKGEKESIAKASGVKAETKASAEVASKSLTTQSANSKASVPKAPTVAPTSAAAVMEDGKTVISAVERIAVTGSTLSRGAGAKAEPMQPKAKAKVAAPSTPAKAMPTDTISKVTSPPVAPKATAPSAQRVANDAGIKQQTPCLVAPPSVLNIVSGKPLPAQGAETTKAVTANLNSSDTWTSSNQPLEHNLGPARAYAAMAAPFIPAPPTNVTTKGVDGKAFDVPKEGPAAVAVGRALAAAPGTPPINALAEKPTACIDKKYQICFVTSEVAPFSKTGGLGEAMDGLPTALAALGHRVMVIAPRYDQYKEAWDTGFWSSVTMGGVQESVHFFHAFKQKVDYVFVDHPSFLERVDGLTGSKLYGPEWGKDFADNQARFAYFCKAALLAIGELPLGGFPYGNDCMVVCNDWHSALVPMFIHAERSASHGRWATTKTAFLCHNAVFQGRFMREDGIAAVMGVPEHYIDSITFNMPLKVGKYNQKVLCVNTMAAGLLYSDRALTVSPSYAIECAKDPDKGVELEDLFALGKVTGILNGVKEGVSPFDQNFVTKTKMSCGTFSAATAHLAKAELKAEYQAQNNLPDVEGPLLCFIGRLDAQKGYDLLLEALIDVLEDTEMQVVIVGAGRADLVAQTRAVEKKFPGKFFYAGWMGPERYALLAASDFTLLPSRWEPCGLVQMEAMRVGTCPIVAPTGGLKDTVEDGLNGLWTDSEMTVEAEVDEESVASIARALRRSSKLFIQEPAKMVEMKKAAMAAAAEFTWSNAALQYEAVFEELGIKNVLPADRSATVTLETDRQVC